MQWGEKQICFVGFVLLLTRKEDGALKKISKSHEVTGKNTELRFILKEYHLHLDLNPNSENYNLFYKLATTTQIRSILPSYGWLHFTIIAPKGPRVTEESFAIFDS